MKCLSLLVTTTIALGGCYSYRALPPEAPVPLVQRIRLDLTDEGRVAVAPMAGRGVDQVEGIVRTTPSVSYVMQVAAVRRNNSLEPWTGERLEIPVRDVESVQVRRFDALRSAGLAVGAVALASLVRVGGWDVLPGGKRGGTGSTSGR